MRLINCSRGLFSLNTEVVLVDLQRVLISMQFSHVWILRVYKEMSAQ